MTSDEAIGSAVQIIRDFVTDATAVWRAWTDASIVSKWFGSDPAGTVLNATLDVRPEGAYIAR